MSSATAHRGRKRRRDDAHGGTSPTRRRRLLWPSRTPAVRPFGLRVTLATSPNRKRRRETSSSPRHRHCILDPSQFPAVRPNSLRAELTTTTVPHRRRRKRRVDHSRRPVSTPRCRRSRSRSRSVRSPRNFPAPRPFALRFLLATGASTPRRRRKLAVLDMGNRISQLLGKIIDLAVRRGRIQGTPEVKTDIEVEEIDVVRTIGDLGVPAFELSPPPEKNAPCYEEFDWTKRTGARLQELGFEGRLQEQKHGELTGTLGFTPKEYLSELYTPLTEEDEREVNTLLHDSGHSNKIIVMHEPSNIEITEEKLLCLRHRGWLNDEIINLYIELLKERAEREPKRFLKCHFFNTFFYKKLTLGIAGYDYQSVRRWTTFKKLGYGLIECEKIFIPIHRNMHWSLAVINMKDKTFQYLDSLGGLGNDVLRVLARYIMDELKDKSGIEIDISSWVEVSDSLPLQRNMWDCGMFMLKFMDFHSRGLRPSFSQDNMMYFRKRTTKEIVRLRAD